MNITCAVCSCLIREPSLAGAAVRCSVCESPAHPSCAKTEQLIDGSLQWLCSKCTSTTVTAVTESPSLFSDKTTATTALNTSHFNAIMSQLTMLNSAITRCASEIENLNISIRENRDSIRTCEHAISDIKNENKNILTRLQEVESNYQLNTDELFLEATERLRREKNIIIMGLPDANDVNKDRQSLCDLFSKLLPNQNIEILRLLRFGKNSKGPRPLKVELSSCKHVTDILKNKNKIPREIYPSISLKNDLTIHQLKQLENLRKDLERRRKNGETNLTIKYVKKVPTIISVDDSQDSSNKRGRDEVISPKRDLGLKYPRQSTSHVE